MTSLETEIYQGQFGEFTINDRDRAEVVVYRAGLMASALSFALGSGLILWQGITPTVSLITNLLFGVFILGLGVSLTTIHIYLKPLHRVLQGFWLVGTIASGVLAWQSGNSLAVFVYNHPLTIFGVGFLFAALTGIFFKEAFCFNRLETKILTPLIPLLLLGHMSNILSLGAEQVLLATWAIFYLIFAIRKSVQAIPPDIGDKSVFVYLKQQKQAVKN
ncbi:MAG: DUF2301 domain-containing membrane protein [Spirulinaceae cyanobacterium]